VVGVKTIVLDDYFFPSPLPSNQYSIISDSYSFHFTDNFMQ